jgi:23S rRNA (uracil1939-C5)-methyltransferase
MAYGGEALGRLPDGRAVFAPGGIPGELVSLRIIEEKRGHARAELVDVLEPSPVRIAARCAHFGACGGCHYQYLPYETQLATKTQILADQLARIGGLTGLAPRPAVGSPNAFNYRNHVQFALTPAGRLGYHRARSNEVLEIRECHLPETELNMIWPQLNFEAIPDLERIGLRIGARNDIQLMLESQDPQPPEISVEELDISVVHLSPAGSILLAGSEAIAIEILERVFRISAGSFFQVNQAMAEAMVLHILDTIPIYQPLTAETTVLDVYCGAGLFSKFLAEKVGRLIGIESSPYASDDFVVNLDEYEHVELYEAAAEDVLPALDITPQVIVVDPPRQGLERVVLDELLRLAAPLLVYVSCDPATLSRDARRLTAGGYRLDQITPFDLFPQTYHIESISFWVRTP